MSGIFDHQFSFAELCITFAFALVAERIWKIIPRARNFISDLLAQRSRLSLERQIRRLERNIEALRSDLADNLRLIMKISIVAGRGVTIGLISVIFFNLALYGDIRIDISLLKEAVGAAPRGGHGLMPFISYPFSPQLSAELTTLLTFLIGLWLLWAAVKLLDQLGIYLQPEDELERLNRRVEALKAKLALRRERGSS
jgi:hypothetical protein